MNKEKRTKLIAVIIVLLFVGTAATVGIASMI